jgi:CheY-like chemotaxis protein
MNVLWEQTRYAEVISCLDGEKVAESRRMVLVVEDEALVRMNAADLIRDLGYEVLEAIDADHAISLLETIPEIAILFTDIQMPGSMDGLRLAAVTRNRWPPVALLVTSGQVRPPATELPAGARFVSKPYMAHELKTHLSALAA